MGPKFSGLYGKITLDEKLIKQLIQSLANVLYLVCNNNVLFRCNINFWMYIDYSLEESF